MGGGKLINSEWREFHQNPILSVLPDESPWQKKKSPKLEVRGEGLGLMTPKPFCQYLNMKILLRSLSFKSPF